MAKDPSIHITKSQFENILSYLEIDHFPVEAFFVAASKVATNTRNVVVSNKRDTNKINNTLLASKGDAALVADLIYATRIKLRHRGVRKIQETNIREWTNCKKLASVCNDFCQSFNLETRSGFIKYIEMGISRMSDHRNLVLRLIGMSETLFNLYSSVEEMGELDKESKDIMKKYHDYYVQKIADRTGIYEPMDKYPERMIHFKKLYDVLNKRGWADDYTKYIDAQFEALAWCNNLPEVQNLYNEKAIERYNKYMYKLNKQPSTIEDDSPEVEGSLWDKINDQ